MRNVKPQLYDAGLSHVAQPRSPLDINETNRSEEVSADEETFAYLRLP